MAREQQGDTPLHWAARHNSNPAVIAALIQAGADPKAQTRFDGETPLHEAADNNTNPAVISVLIEAGSDPNAQTNDMERTPLHKAAKSNDNPAVMDALLDGGADPEILDSEFRGPWDIARDRDELKGSKAYRRLQEALE